MATSFREVSINVENTVKWREISVKTGADPSGASDTRFGEDAGGYAFQDSSRTGSACRNRFIYWRTYRDVLELVEVSLDYNLTNNSIRFHFTNSAILEGSVSVHESAGNVFVLVSTVSSIHRLVFPHPNRLQQYDQGFLQGTEQNILSIFSDATVAKFHDPSNVYCYNTSGQSAQDVSTSSSWISTGGEALFTIATVVGTVALMKLPPQGSQGVVTQHELKCSSMMQRLWTGLVPGVLRGGSEHVETTLSQVIHPIGQDTLAFSVCKDHKLRIWSCKTYDCLHITDLLQFIPDNLDPQKLVIGGSGHVIRKAVGSSGRSLTLGIFMCFTERPMLIVVQPVQAEGAYTIHHITNVFPGQENLLDFCLTSTFLWSQWRNTEGEVIVKCANIDRNSSHWLPFHPVQMEPEPHFELEIPSHVDPREFYMEQIFYPDSFSTYTILKALSIYKRSLDSTQLQDSTVPVQALKAEVSAIVELEIQKAASEYEMVQEEYVQLQTQQWSKFYSCCVQYQQSSMKCLGMMADANTGLVAVVKKHGVSLVRPADMVEHLYLSPSEHCHIEDLALLHSVFAGDEPLSRDVLSLCDCLKSLRGCLTEEMTYCFEQDMFHTQNPADVTRTIVNNILADPGSERRDVPGYVREISLQLQSVRDLVQAVECILLLLDLTEEQDGMAMDNSDGVQSLTAGRLFSSCDAVTSLCVSVRQMLDARFEMSRDLLMFLTLCLHIKDQVGLDLGVSRKFQSDFVHKAAMLVQVYYAMKWASSAITVHPQMSLIECNGRQLESLDLIESATYNPMQKFVGQNLTLMELFLKSDGGSKLQEVLATRNVIDEDPCAFWSHGLVPVVRAATQLLWPLSGRPVFLEFLLSHCQLVHIQEFVRLTSDWCELNSSAARFILAYSYLTASEPHKALECFLEATHNVAGDQFLLDLIQCEGHDPALYDVMYYLKVMRLFEVCKLPEQVVSLAKTAISTAEDGDPALATLWSKIFKQELEMGHNEEAYNAMLSNPDSSRRKDCLRQFLVILCERSELQTLVELPYKDRHVDLEEEVVNILESRARSIDLMKQTYYDLLYAFHVFRGNYRKAGSVMYEYGMRLGVEVSGLKGLQKQAKCYLAALNTLRLVNTKYAWIVKPANSLQEEEEMSGTAVKHTLDGDELEIPTKKQVEILELEDIEKEYMLVHARLQLLQRHPDPSHMRGPTSSADETIGLLCSAGLFDSAINICKMYKLSLTPVFEGLASRCIKLSEQSNSHMHGDNELTAPAWDWLQHNSLPTNNTPKETSSTEQAWRLLQKYLDTFEDKNSVYHRAVATRFFSQGFPLPNWFTATYKRLNAAELLRLYLDYDMLEEAAYLSLEYIDAATGKGKEYFGLKTYLHAGAPAIWLPYTSFDQLLSALREVPTEPTLCKLYIDVSDRLEDLFDTVDRVSQDNLEMAYRNTSIFVTSR